MNKRGFLFFIGLQWLGALVIIFTGRLHWTRGDLSEDFLIGIPAGVALFLILVRRPLEMVGSARRLTRFQVSGRSGFFLANSLAEELIWRGWLLATLAPLTSPLRACVFTSLGFALMHLGLQGVRNTLGHLLTGMVFGLCYISGPSILCAYIAHLTYNMMFLGRTSAPQPAAAVSI